MFNRAGFSGTGRWFAVVALSALSTHFVTTGADDPPPREDLDGDEIKDPIETNPNPPGDEPGEIEIRSGENGQLIVTIRGRENNDRFGYSVAVIDDLNLDTHKDLIIGAPRDSEEGRAYVRCSSLQTTQT